MGEFVKDIQIPELKFELPKIQKFRSEAGDQIYALPSDGNPLSELEIHFYDGYDVAYPLETPNIFFGVWKLGGTKSYPGEKFLERLEFLGAKISLTKQYEKTVLSLSYLHRDEEQIFRLLEEWVQSPNLRTQDLVVVRSQALDAIRRRNDSVPGLGIRKTKEMVFRNSGRGMVESIPSLESIQIKDLQLFHKKTFLNSPRKILFTGLSDPKMISDKVQTIFQNSANRESKDSGLKEPNYFELKKDFSSLSNQIVLIEKDTNQSMVVFSGIMPPHNHKDFYGIQVLNYILGGGGFNSYFMTEIRNNRGLAYSTTSHISFEKDFGLFLGYSLTKNESVPEVIHLMRDILSKNRISQIRQDELDRAKNAIINQFVFLFDSRSKILSNQLRFDEHEMPDDYLYEFRKNIQNVKLEDLYRVGSEYFDSGKLRILVVGPQSVISSDPKLGTFQKMQPEELFRR
jgi:predicted Zn-dependent peptidase